MVKRIAALSALMLACTAAGFLGGTIATLSRQRRAADSSPETLKARRFQVVDQHGRTTAELTPTGLDLLGSDGRVRATLRLGYNNKGYLGFSDALWEGRAIFGFLGTDTPSDWDDDWGLLIFRPDKRRPVVGLGTSARGTRGFLAVWSDKEVREILAP